MRRALRSVPVFFGLPFRFRGVFFIATSSLGLGACDDSVASTAGEPVDDAAVRRQDAGDAPGAGGKGDGVGGQGGATGGAPETPAGGAGGTGGQGGASDKPDADRPTTPDAAPSGADAAGGAADPPDAAEPPPADPCPEPDLGDTDDWRHGLASPAIVGLGLPHHSAVEPIVNPGEALVVPGKFAYGAISKDLEDEDVTLYVRLPDPGDARCGAWHEVGTATTDSDGRATVEVGPALVPEPGAYAFRFVVRGDHTFARGALWVVEPGAALVLFDVDGTLTIGDSEIFEQVLLGQDPEMYEAADAVAWTYADLGYQPLYVTGRPYMLNLATRDWLDARGFPPGPVRTADSVAQVLPTADGVQTYKREYLREVIDAADVDIPYAYGNATTDICAYAQVGIDPARTYIIGPNAGGACDGFAATQPVADYPSHLPTLAALPPAP